MKRYNDWETGISITKPAPETARKLSELVYQSGKRRNIQTLFAEMVTNQHELEYGDGGLPALRARVEELEKTVSDLQLVVNNINFALG